MKYGFETNISPVPDNLLLDITLREYQRRSMEKTHFEYLIYKLGKLQDVNQSEVAKGLIEMSQNAQMRLMYRIKAIKVVQATIDTITGPGGLKES